MSRRLTPEGRVIVVWMLAGVAFLILTLLIMVPSRFGVPGW